MLHLYIYFLYFFSSINLLLTFVILLFCFKPLQPHHNVLCCLTVCTFPSYVSFISSSCNGHFSCTIDIGKKIPSYHGAIFLYETYIDLLFIFARSKQLVFLRGSCVKITDGLFHLFPSAPATLRKLFDKHSYMHMHVVVKSVTLLNCATSPFSLWMNACVIMCEVYV